MAGEFGLMGRGIDLATLVAALEPAWLQRVRLSGSRGGSFWLSTDTSRAEVRVSASGIQVGTQTDSEVAPLLNERTFAHLLFHSLDETAVHLGVQADSDLLRVLFPEQDFVIWRADAF